MKAILQLTLCGYRPAEDELGEEDLHLELWRDIELPSLPPIGLKIIVDSISDNHADAERFDNLLGQFIERTSRPVIPLFPIESVVYKVDQGVVYAQIRYEFPPDDIDDLRLLAELLIVGYAFYRS